MKLLITLTTKSGKKIKIVQPTMDMLDEITDFVNRLAKEDTFLSFDPTKEITKDEERVWLENMLNKIKFKKAALIWAVYNGQIVGSCDYHHGNSIRDWHVGSIGLMVDKDFRDEGIGRFLLEYVLKKAQEAGVKIATLTVFSDNEIAQKVYKKVGFSECGRIPNGFIRQGKYSDCVRMYKELS